MKRRVLLAYPYGDIEPAFMRSVAHLLVWDAKHHRYVIDGGYLDYQTTNLPHGRNQIVRKFLDFDGVDYLWFVDTDQEFPPDTLDRLMETCSPGRPIVGALIYTMDNRKTQRFWPTVWSWDDNGLPQQWSTAPRNRLLGPEHGVAATGTGCVLIHRSVVEKLYAKHGHTSWPWFKYSDIVVNGEPDVFGEDLTFMARAGAEGFPVHVDTRVEVGHVKRLHVGSSDHVRDLPWDRMLPETYVVIPVKDRLDLTKQIIRDLRAQGGYDGLFVFDNGSRKDTREWLAKQDVEVFDAAGANIHQMWNAGIKEAVARWPKANVAILNNDLKIGPDFLSGLSGALRAADELVAVGPNYDGREIEGPIQPVRGISANRYDGTGGLPGFAFMVKGEMFAMGFPGFDENLSWWYGDNDFCLNADQRGLIYALVRDATVEHIGGGSQSGAPDPQEIATDRAYFEAKWA